MKGDLVSILTINLLFSTLVFWIAARLYVLPRLGELRPRSVLLPILLLHSFRHLGLMFLAPGATSAGIPSRFAVPAAVGDLVAAILAVAAIAAVATGDRRARVLVWVFSVEGTADLLAAIALATIHDAGPSMGPAYWIPALWVPALLVTHYVAFAVLRHASPSLGVLERRGSVQASGGGSPSLERRPVRAGDGDVERRVRDHPLRNAPMDRAGDRRPAVRPEHDEVGVQVGGGPQDLEASIATAYDGAGDRH
jgi:hypothetical protein